MLLIIFIAVIIVILLAMVIAGISISAPKYRGPVSDHFDGSRFINPGNAQAKGTLDVIKWMFSRKPPRWSDNSGEPSGKRPLDHFRDGIRVTFINHSTFLIQIDGVNILTDPIWSKRASPFNWMGPKRVKAPGIRFEDLPGIHVVLLTHNHYDHLDIQTMRMVFGAHHPKIITPLGVKAFLAQQYIVGVTETDWWDELTINAQLKIQAVPAQHFSGRGMLDRDATLWCGFVLKTSKGNIYYAGDTGYNEFTFKEIGKQFSPIKLSFLPIGAYKPRWFMSPIHSSPEEAISIHRDVQSETSIAMHFGTFPLADDGIDDPVDDLHTAMASHKMKSAEFLVLKEGEVQVFEGGV